MAKKRKEKLDDILSTLMQVGQIKASGIVSKEGLLINSRTPPNVDARIFSALCSTIIGAAEAASSQMATGIVSQISVKTESWLYGISCLRFFILVSLLEKVTGKEFTYNLQADHKGKPTGHRINYLEKSI